MPITPLYLPPKPAIIVPRKAEIIRPGDPRFVLGLGAGGAAAAASYGAASYATLNPSDKSAAVTLSNGNLTMATSTADVGVRSTSGKSSGKIYIEVTQGTTAVTVMQWGVATIGDTLDGAGFTANSWGYIQSTGNKIHSGSGAAYGSSWVQANVLMLALDMDNGKIWWGKSGTWASSGDPAAGTNAAYTGLTGTLYLMLGTNNSGSTSMTVNFGASAFTYTPPSGFSGWTA